MDLVLLGKSALAVFGCTATTFLLCKRPYEPLSDRAFTRAALGVLAFLRFAVYLAVLVIAGIAAQSDVLTYHDLGKHILAGEVPHRDFFNGYAPLFPYLASIPLRLWDSPKSIIFLSILFELVSLPFWLSVARRAFGEQVARQAAILYVFNPFLLWAIPLSGQNNVWLALALAVSLHLLFQGRELASGLVFGAGVVLVKFLSLLHAPALFIAAPRKARFTLGLLALPVIVYGTLFLGHISVMASLKYHSADASSGNIPYLLTLFRLDPHEPGLNRVYNLAGVAVLGVIFLVPLVKHGHGPLWRRAFDRRQVIHLVTALLFALLLVSRKSFSGYLIIAFFAICATTASGGLGRRSLAAFLVFSVVVTLESSLWFRWLGQAGLHVLWRSPLPEGVTRPRAAAFFLVELALLGFYAWYCREALRRVGEGAPTRA